MIQHKNAHRIRLRKPWKRYDHAVGPADGGRTGIRHLSLAVQGIRVDVPDLSPVDSTGNLDSVSLVTRVTYVRKFHRPSGIEVGDTVQLEVGAVRGKIAEILINAVSIGDDAVERIQGPLCRWDLEDRLTDHNELKIVLESTAHAPGPPRLVGEVNLWIISTH